MTLPSGTQLGPYQIVSPLGAGGMGEVYKARDTRLDRTVAIKILPAGLASDPEFRERLEREARVISQLDHAHICALYDVGRSDGALYLVLQYLEGETLDVRLRQGALPVPLALEYGMQVADALARAHRAGIVHRDLKPANIMLTKSGARLLDFGLASTHSDPFAAPTGENDKTGTRPLTAAGTILGTFQYMAPEQVEGRPADHRADVWALGCVLYEMLSGARAFEGASPASVLAKILTAAPPSLRAADARVGAGLDHVVQRCLEKDPDARWQSAADVGHALRWIAAATAESGAVSYRPVWKQPWVYACGVLLIALGLVAGRWLPRGATPPSAAAPLNVTIVSPPDLTLTPFGSNGVPHFALSPDGNRIAFVAAAAARAPSLWVRRLDSRVPQEMPGSSDASAPFWSPDSRSLGFFAQGQLKRIGVDGQRAQVLASIIDAAGGTWSGDVILVGRSTGPVMRIALDGRPMIEATAPPGEEVGHRWPQFLPDGQHFIYSTPRGTVTLAQLGSVRGTRVLDRTSTAVFAAPATVLFVPTGTYTLMARDLDVSSGKFTTAAREAVDGVKYVSGSGYPPASVAPGGLLAYWDGSTVSTELNWRDRTGATLSTLPIPPDAETFAISPDGRSTAIAFTRRADGGRRQVWLMNATGGVSKLSFTERGASAPIWSRDGRAVYYSSSYPNGLVMLRRDLDGGERELAKIPYDDPAAPGVLQGNFYAADWSADGRTALVSLTHTATARDILAFSPDTGTLTPLFHSPSYEVQPRFSPDDRWIAYASNATGTWEVLVEPSSGAGPRAQISVEGGSQPLWRTDGKELFFLAPDGKLMSAAVHPGPAWHHDTPKVLFQTRMRATFAPYPVRYAVTPDGARFLLDEVRPGTAPTISLLTNWRTSVERRE